MVREHGFAHDATVLDIFTGSGALGVAAAREGARAVTAIDISRRALLNTWLNAFLNLVRIRTLRGDVFGPVAGERFDLILANPPYLPSETDHLPTHGPARAWEAGTDGRAFLDRVAAEAAEHLTAAGNVLIVQSSLSGEQATLDGLRASGLAADVLVRLRGPLGPIAAERAKMLERRGLLAPGKREEELLILRGAR